MPLSEKKRGDYTMTVVRNNGVGEITEQKSRFIAHVFNIESEQEALALLAAIKKQYWDARHNCYAYVCDSEVPVKRFSDDGEPAGTAGKPILEVITGNDLSNCLVVVTRYFGGVLLGTGGLIRAYTDATKEGLRDSCVSEVSDGIQGVLSVDYTTFGKLQYICSELGVSIINTEYADNVTLTVVMNRELKDAFDKKIQDISAGKISLCDISGVKMCIDYEGNFSLL